MPIKSGLIITNVNYDDGLVCAETSNFLPLFSGLSSALEL